MGKSKVFKAKTSTFGLPFGIDFSMFFENGENALDSTFSNRKAASEPSKSINFRIDFSLNFHVFPEPPSRGHSSRIKMPTYPQKCGFGPIFDFPGVPKSTLGDPFSAKKAPKVEYPS